LLLLLLLLLLYPLPLQAEVAEDIGALDAALTQQLPERDDQLAVLCGAYAAYDLAWQMEEVLLEEPDLDKLANCVALLRVRRCAAAAAAGGDGGTFVVLIRA
jgi:hypothetical protein